MLALCFGTIATLLHAAPIDADEEILLLTGIARLADNGRIEIDVHAWRHEKEPLIAAHRLLARYMDVGDSGESDAEIYGQLARKHAGRIHGVVIRDATGEARESPRYLQSFEGVDPGLWHVVHERDAWPLPAAPGR